MLDQLEDLNDNMKSLQTDLSKEVKAINQKMGIDLKTGDFNATSKRDFFLAQIINR